MNPDIEGYENDLELDLFHEYRDVINPFSTWLRPNDFYLCNQVDVQVHPQAMTSFELRLQDAWVWDIHRSSRFVKSVRIMTFKDINIEELSKSELSCQCRGRARVPQPALIT